MANYMAEVAKMLGVELGEEFKCYGEDYTYKFTDKGLMCNGCEASCILSLLLEGQIEIKRKPWRPKYGEDYYVVNMCGIVGRNRNENCFIDIVNYKIGNCYRTHKEAECNLNKWIAFYASDEVLEVQ